MNFSTIDKMYYEQELAEYQDAYQQHKKGIKDLIIFILLAIGIGVISFINNPRNENSLLTFITIIAMTAVLIFILFIICTLLPLKKKSVKAINEIEKILLYTPLLKFEENGSIMYQVATDKIEYLDSIKQYKRIQYSPKANEPEYSFIEIKGEYQGKEKAIYVIDRFEEINHIFEILEIFTKIENAKKPFINTLKDTIEMYSNNAELLLQDIKEMIFIAPINFKFHTSKQGNHFIFLEYGAIEPDIYIDENQEAYVCLYSSKDEIKSNLKRYIQTTYMKTLELITKNESSVFAENRIKGIVINKHSDCIKIRINV